MYFSVAQKYNMFCTQNYKNIFMILQRPILKTGLQIRVDCATR
jgi:hypothetical protein